MGHNEIGVGQSSYAADQHRSKPALEKWFQVNQPYILTLVVYFGGYMYI